VVDAITGQPLNKVEVQAEKTVSSDSSRVVFTMADSKGNFTLVDLRPGQYRLKGLRNGYLETYYGARRSETNGTLITLEAGQSLTICN
jgi:hypothetical protein